MDYTALGIINSTPQEIILTEPYTSNISTNAVSASLSASLIKTKKMTQEDHLMGVLAKCGVDHNNKIDDNELLRQITNNANCNNFNSNINKIIYNNNNNNNNSSNNNNNNISNGSLRTNCTKIQLNFSVDRLLGINNEDSINDDYHHNNRINSDSFNNASKCTFNGCNGDNRLEFDCCPYGNNGIIFRGIASNNFQSSLPMMDIKSIVRPTPIRVNHLSSALPSPPTSLFNGTQLVKYKPITSQSLQCSVANINHFKSQQQPVMQTFRQTVSTSEGNSNGNMTAGGGKRKRSWSRAVFSNLQRKGLEIQFQVQKYITKPDRRKLAARLNLTDAQVKVWFQNRRMKWRHTRENLKSGQEKPIDEIAKSTGDAATSSDEDEIDVVAE